MMAGASPERNTELIRRGFEAFDAREVDAVLRILAEDVEVHTAPGLLNAGTYRGRDGYLVWLTAWLEAWEDFEAEPTRLEPIGERHVLVTVHQTARGAGSGVGVEMWNHWAFEVSGEQVTRIHLYPEREQALGAIEGWRERGESGG
jgi:ketosteroid isomerase-like protein